MTPEIEAKLERLKNYHTRYEVIMERGTERVLVVYMHNQSYRRLREAVVEKINPIQTFAGASVYEEAMGRGKRSLAAGDWRIRFSGRTQREAILQGELPFVGTLAATAAVDQRCIAA
jgi:hypothetical protein